MNLSMLKPGGMGKIQDVKVKALFTPPLHSVLIGVQ
jgi:hypothetical protein